MNELYKKQKHKIRGLDLVGMLIATSLGILFFLCVTRSIEGIAIINP